MCLPACLPAAGRAGIRALHSHSAGRQRTRAAMRRENLTLSPPHSSARACSAAAAGLGWGGARQAMARSSVPQNGLAAARSLMRSLPANGRPPCSLGDPASTLQAPSCTHSSSGLVVPFIVTCGCSFRPTRRAALSAFLSANGNASSHACCTCAAGGRQGARVAAGVGGRRARRRAWVPARCACCIGTTQLGGPAGPAGWRRSCPQVCERLVSRMRRRSKGAARACLAKENVHSPVPRAPQLLQQRALLRRRQGHGQQRRGGVWRQWQAAAEAAGRCGQAGAALVPRAGMGAGVACSPAPSTRHLHPASRHHRQAGGRRAAPTCCALLAAAARRLFRSPPHCATTAAALSTRKPAALSSAVGQAANSGKAGWCGRTAASAQTALAKGAAAGGSTCVKASWHGWRSGHGMESAHSGRRTILAVARVGEQLAHALAPRAADRLQGKGAGEKRVPPWVGSRAWAEAGGCWGAPRHAGGPVPNFPG